MKNKKHIAMRCNKEQFEAIKPKLEKIGSIGYLIGAFDEYFYLCNNYRYNDFIGNQLFFDFINLDFTAAMHENIHEEWNEKIFLEACGIETIPTLEEVKKRFKDADTIKSCISDSVYEINTELLGIYFDGRNYRQNTDSDKRELLLWEENQGYAKILTYKTPKFEITKEQIILLMDKCKLGGVTEKRLKEWFPEVFKPLLEVGKWYKSDAGGLWFIEKFKDGIKTQTSYGINKYGDWQDISYTRNSTGLVLATPEEVAEALKKEAVMKGYNNGNYKCLSVPKYTHKVKGIYFFDKEKNRLLIGDTGDYNGKNNIVFDNGIWANVIPTKTIQEAEELLKELGHEIKIVS